MLIIAFPIFFVYTVISKWTLIWSVTALLVLFDDHNGVMRLKVLLRVVWQNDIWHIFSIMISFAVLTIVCTVKV